MANTYETLSQLFTATAEKLRKKLGTTSKIVADNFPESIDSILTPTDGSIATKTASDMTVSGATVTAPAGYYANASSKSVATATQATPSITVSSSGLITASATQDAGYVLAGTKSATQQLATQAAKTIYPSSQSQTAIAASVYATGAVTVAGINNFCHDGYTRFYMHGNSLADQSGNGKSISNSGTGVTTATSKFGGNSIRVSTWTNFYVPNCISGSGAFTVEMWVYLNHKDGNANNLHCLWSHGGSNAAARTGGTLVWGGNGFGWYNSGWMFTTNASFAGYTWHHVAFVGDGSSIKLYVNGVLQCTSNGSYNLSTSGERFGMNDSDMTYNGSSDLYIQGIRLSNCARYTGNFTPPTEYFATHYR